MDYKEIHSQIAQKYGTHPDVISYIRCNLIGKGFSFEELRDRQPQKISELRKHIHHSTQSIDERTKYAEKYPKDKERHLRLAEVNRENVKNYINALNKRAIIYNFLNGLDEQSLQDIVRPVTVE